MAEENDDLQPNELIAKCEKAANHIFESFKNELRLKQKASDDVVNAIPLVAAGSHKRRKLHFVAPGVRDADFLPELWSLAIKRCKVQKRLLFCAVSNYKQQRFNLQDNYADTLSPEERVRMTQLVQELSNATSSPASEETDGNERIPLNEEQSKRVYKALATSLFGGLGVGAAGGLTGVGVGAAVWGATALIMVAAGPVGAIVGGAVGVIGLGVLTGVVIYQYRKSKKLETVTE